MFKQEILIGSSEANDVVIADPSVDSFHAKFIIEDSYPASMIMIQINISDALIIILTRVSTIFDRTAIPRIGETLGLGFLKMSQLR